MTPFHGYNSETYPFIMIRTNRIYAMDVATFDMIQFSQEDMTFRWDDEYRGLYRNMVGVAENKFATFGLKVEKKGEELQNSML